MLSNCGNDEKGHITGGKAGDQTGQEFVLKAWYNRPWAMVLRPKSPVVAEEIATLAIRAASNNLVGYDQSQRSTFWKHLEASNYNPSEITIACEADCSSATMSIIKAAGYLLHNDALKAVNQNATTRSMEEILVKSGFTKLTDRKYLDTDFYLLPGDVLLYPGHHTAINISVGIKARDDGVTHYIVRKGDTLSEIAKKYNTTVDILVKENSIADKNLIHVGDKLRVKFSYANSDRKKQQYIIQHGDTLSKIALRFGTTVETLVRDNKIEDKNVIQVGRYLIV